MYSQNYRQEYRTQDVVGATPIRLVVMAYDLAIRSCEKEDFAKATQAISALRDALDFDYPEVSVGLFRLYQYCLDCIRNGDYKNAISVLIELREAWSCVEKRLSPMPKPAVQASQVRVSFAG